MRQLEESCRLSCQRRPADGQDLPDHITPPRRGWLELRGRESSFLRDEPHGLEENFGKQAIFRPDGEWRAERLQHGHVHAGFQRHAFCALGSAARGGEARLLPARIMFAAAIRPFRKIRRKETTVRRNDPRDGGKDGKD